MITNKMETTKFLNLSSILLVACFLSLPLTQGCTAAGGSVIAATGTTIGVELSQSQTSQAPMGVLGYKRAELAYVPTNRGTAGKTTTTQDSGGNPIVTHEGGLQSTASGAKDSANVLMELRYSGIFHWGSGSGIYQRLAVGDKAVSQPGASLMFTKDSTGKIEPEAARALSAAQSSLFEQVSPTDWKKALADAKKRASERRPKIDIIVDEIKSAADETSIDSQKLVALVKKAGLDQSNALVKVLLQLKKSDDLRDYLDEPGQEFVSNLFQAAVLP